MYTVYEMNLDTFTLNDDSTSITHPITEVSRHYSDASLESALADYEEQDRIVFTVVQAH